MQKSTKWATAALATFAAVLSGLYYINRTIPVDVPDPTLRGIIQSAIAKQWYESLDLSEDQQKTLATSIALNTENMAIVKEIDASGVWIKSLEGIQHCTGLNSLRLNHCGITDIAPLARFESMGWLSLNNNQIADLSPLAHWKGAYELGLNDNLISDLTPLQNFHCKELLIAFNQISDLAPIEQMPLQKIAVIDNPLSPKAHIWLTQLETKGATVVK